MRRKMSIYVQCV